MLDSITVRNDFTSATLRASQSLARGNVIVTVTADGTSAAISLTPDDIAALLALLVAVPKPVS